MIKLKQGVGKTITFTITNKKTGAVEDVSTATFTFTVKKDKSLDTPIISKSDSDFTKTDADIGIIKLPLSVIDTDINVDNYIAELKTYYGNTMNDKSRDIVFIIEKAVN